MRKGCIREERAENEGVRVSEKRSEVMAESVRESERVKDGVSERGEGCKSVERSQAFLYCDVFCSLSKAASMFQLLKFLLRFVCLTRFLVEISKSLKPQKLSVQPKKQLLAAETKKNFACKRNYSVLP